MNLPDYHFLPAPLWLITFLHLVTLTLHLMAMNFLVGGVVLVLFGGFKDRWKDEVVTKLVKLFPAVMAATVTLGVAPLLFVQLVYPGQVYAASIVSGWFWLMIIAAAMVSYYFLYGAAFSKKGSGGRRGLYLTLALVGFVYISFVYSSVFAMVERPEHDKLLYAGNPSGLVINPDMGAYLIRWLHMLLGAVTVGGFFIGLFGKDHPPAERAGRRFFLGGMAASMLLGLAYLLTLGKVLVPLMRTPAIGYLLGAILLSLGALRLYLKRRFTASGVLLFVSMLGMVAVRHQVRLLNLAGHYDPAAVAVRPQWSVFVLFLVCFLIALALMAYMLRLYFAGKEA